MITARRCNVCGCIYAPQNQAGHPNRRSRDHILPQAWGGTDALYGIVKNIRLMCQRCNGLRASAGHCLGALAAIRAVTHGTLEMEESVMRRWGFFSVVRVFATVKTLRRPTPAIVAPPMTSVILAPQKPRIVFVHQDKWSLWGADGRPYTARALRA